MKLGILKSLKKLLSILVMICMLNMMNLSALISANTVDNNYYVSTNGDDSTGNGTIENPYKTIQKAADIAVAGDTIIIRGGTYRETVTPLNSGSETKPITFKPYNGETVTVSGTEIITGWTLHSGLIYKAPMNWTNGEDNQIFVDNKMVNFARWPNRADPYDLFGYDTDPIQGTGSDTYHITDSTNLTQEDDYWNGAKVYFEGVQHWTWQSGTVTDFVNSTHKLTFQGDSGYMTRCPPGAGSKYYLAGKLELLDQPNEWYYDSVNKMLYLQIVGGGNPSASIVEAKKRSYAFNINKKNYIVIDGINIFGSGIDGEGSSNTVVNKVIAKYLNHSQDITETLDPGGISSFITKMRGIHFEGDNNVISNCDIDYSCFNSVVVKGKNNKVTNNYIKNSAYSGDGSSVSVKGTNALISHNTLEKSGKLVLDFRDVQNSNIEYNRISGSLATGLDDYGIASGAQTDYQNTQLHHNIIYDILGRKGGNSGGLYPDNYSLNLIIHHNIVYGTDPNPAFRLNQASDFMMIYNNTFIGKLDCGYSFRDGMYGAQFVNNLFTGFYYGEWAQGLYSSNNVFRASTSSFVDPNHDNYSFNSLSPYIDAGTIIEGINEEYQGNAPDLGALEYGGFDWTTICGHDFTIEPTLNMEYPSLRYTNKVVNMGFEMLRVLPNSTGLENWIKTNNKNATVERIDHWRMNEYGYHLKLGSGIDGVEQTVTNLLPNTKYRLSGWLQSASGETIVLGLMNYGGNNVNVACTGTKPERYELSFTTGTNNTSARIYIKKTTWGTGYCYADDIGLIEEFGQLKNSFVEEFDSIETVWTRFANCYIEQTCEIDPAGALHLKANDSISGRLISLVRATDVSITPKYTLETRIKVVDFAKGTIVGSGGCFIRVKDGVYGIEMNLRSDGIYVRDSSNTFVKYYSANLDNNYHIYKIVKTDGTAKVFMDGVLKFTYSIGKREAVYDRVEINAICGSNIIADFYVDYLNISNDLITSIYKGDVNSDGDITITDAMLVFQSLSGRTSELVSSEKEAADIDGNGEVTIADAMKIFQYLSGKIASL